MQKTLPLLAYFLCFAYLHAQAQNKKVLDSLMTVYQTNKHDTTRLLALANIAAYYMNSKPDTCIYIAQKALAQSIKINFEKGKAWAWNRMGIGYYIKGEYPEALTYYQKSLFVFEQMQDI